MEVLAKHYGKVTADLCERATGKWGVEGQQGPVQQSAATGDAAAATPQASQEKAA